MNKWANGIFIGIALICFAVMIGYFFTEGFRTTMAEATARMGSNQADDAAICAEFKKCSTCTDDTKHVGTHCGWCPAAQACIPRSGMYRLIPSWLMDVINLDPTKDCIASDFKYSKGQCSDDSCSDYTNCRDCAGALACGWCSASNTCVSKAAMAAQASQSSSGSGSGSGSGSTVPLCSTSLVSQSGSCPPPVCSEIKDCGQCTNTTGCGYCKDTGTCISIDGNGSSLGGSSGSTGCAQGSIYTQVYQCPCSALTKCTDCAQRPGCGYCTTTSKCITTEAPMGLGGNSRILPIPTDKLDCASDKIATTTSQCVPGATLPNLLLNTRTARDPTAAELAMAQDSGILGGNELNAPAEYLGARGAGDGAVSPPSTSQYVSGNGVVRRYGATGGPPSAANSTGLGDAPLESYVKMLVTSELAAQGVPTNEPFQVNEVQSIPNATEILKKSMNNILMD